MDFDLILRGGRVIDPASGLDGVRDVAFAGGTVAAIGEGLAGGAATEIRDVAGHIVTPGLIDLHTHVYWGGSAISVDPLHYGKLAGCSTLVDTGSAGPGNFAGFRAHVIAPCPIRILAYLHISFAGVFAFGRRIMVGESQDIRLMAPRDALEVAEANRDVIVGIKVRVGRRASGDQGVAPLRSAIQVAEAAGLSVMAHIDEPPPDYDEVLALLRPGDVLTHAFRPFPNSPVGGDGKARATVRAAREKGVIFDIAHGQGSFGFGTARAMLADGFEPDVISSDVHALCIDGPAYDLPTTLSKFLCLGMPLERVIASASTAPADAVGRPELGRLVPGGVGDATVLALDEGAFSYRDVLGEEMIGDRRLSAKGLVAGGRWIG
ncbi:MAG: amidohydrolase/deacetylase family metallohydrolase [Pseudomonadota bacterium]